MFIDAFDRHIDRKKPPPPRGVSYLLCSLIQNREKEGTPEEPPSKLINFGGGSSGGVLFLPVLDQGT